MRNFICEVGFFFTPPPFFVDIKVNTIFSNQLSGIFKYKLNILLKDYFLFCDSSGFWINKIVSIDHPHGSQRY